MGANVSVTYQQVPSSLLVTVAEGSAGASNTISYATGTLAAGLTLTQATGATLSQGQGVTSPAATMNQILTQTTNWATFFTAQSVSLAEKEAFATWTNLQSKHYAYVSDDEDITATELGVGTCFGNWLQQGNPDGTFPVYSPVNGPLNAAMVSGFVASIDFTRTRGRVTFAYKGQDGLIPDTTDQTTANNLVTNGYNYYGAVAENSNNFQYIYPGSVTGEFKYFDSYVNQIYLNSQLRLALIEALTTYGYIPYNQYGYGLVRAAISVPAAQGVAFGSINPGVTLSPAQVSELVAQAGFDISPELFQNGWYLQILDATAQVRGVRGSPPCTFWYVDGQSIQSINLLSEDVL